MGLIQSALVKAMSGAVQKIFFIKFGCFLTFLHNFEVKGLPFFWWGVSESSTVICKEAASKLWRKGGGNNLSNKKCFVGRTVMIQNALHSSDLGERFKYPELMCTTHRKVFNGIWSESLRQKLTQNDRIFWSLTELQRLEFQKSTLKTLTSEALRKFSMGRTHTFWVCKTFSYIRVM